ncbi:MAG: hypothetical protein GY731_13630, partial [Gammaproteobacteria bacterium]|nr:hypothetical protein [Gammaproteobacteria bacterium]
MTAIQVQPAAKAMGVVLRSAQWMGSGKAKPITTRPGAEPPVMAETSPEPVETENVEKPNPLFTPDILPSTPSGPAKAVPVCSGQTGVAEAEPTELLPATVAPEPPRPTVPAEVTKREATIHLGDRRYRIRGLQKNLSFEQLKVNLLV